MNINNKIAVLIPCCNEEMAVGQVVSAFKCALPDAAIYVYDNNSTDNTAEKARQAGAIVRTETRQGKGSVVRRMFADVEADIYVLIDGDDTYHAPAVNLLITRLLDEDLDMVVGCRQHTESTAYPLGHQLGNHMFTWVVRWLFGRSFSDLLSGYRVFSRRFVKSFPVFSAGFEIETEIAIHSLLLKLPTAEIVTPYRPRLHSQSKLRTYRDGWRILRLIIKLVMLERPLQLFTIIFGLLFILSAVLGTPIIAEWLSTGLVPRFPTAILCTGLMLLAFFSLGFGYLLSMHCRSRIEAKLLAYLQISKLGR
jgi:glycosyltransferase involved in cell wall biosynthesis